MAKPQADADQPDPAGTIAKIITVATQKGGAGKTTTSMNVAADFARRGYRALVVSAAKQVSAVAWAAAASEGKPFPARDRKSVGEGTGVSVRVDLGGSSQIQKKK